MKAEERAEEQNRVRQQVGGGQLQGQAAVGRCWQG